PTPREVGAVRIVTVTGPWVTLVPVDPRWVDVTFVFDLAARRWLGPAAQPSWQLAAVPCESAGASDAAFSSCWGGLADGRPVNLLVPRVADRPGWSSSLLFELRWLDDTLNPLLE